jgi:cytochrome d ubiquinol oxidase subunit I
MVGLGFLFLLVFLLLLYYQRTDVLEQKTWLLKLGLSLFFLGLIAQETGWIVAEVGRQPWAIQGLLPVSIARTNLTAGTVATTFFMFLILFTALLIAEIRIMLTQIKNGPEEV